MYEIPIELVPKINALNDWIANLLPEKRVIASQVLDNLEHACIQPALEKYHLNDPQDVIEYHEDAYWTTFNYFLDHAGEHLRNVGQVKISDGEGHEIIFENPFSDVPF